MAILYSRDGMSFAYTKDQDPDDSEFVLHVHDTYEILCFVSGNVKYLVEGREYPMYPGCLMLMRPAETHRLLVKGRGCYERYIINFRADDLKDVGISEDMLAPFASRNLGEKNQYLSSEFCGIDPAGLFRQMSAECKSLDPRRGILSNLAALMCAVNAAFVEKQSREYSYAIHDIGREIIEYINNNLTEEVSLDLVSAHVHMSPSQVNRIFRKLTGTSVYDYILSKRLVMVQELITNGEGAVIASQRCGFRDYSAFYRIYKKRIGTAPSDAKRR